MPAGTTDIEPARILLPRVETQQEASGGTRAVRSGRRPNGPRNRMGLGGLHEESNYDITDPGRCHRFGTMGR
jgi:hypothetical protein